MKTKKIKKRNGAKLKDHLFKFLSALDTEIFQKIHLRLVLTECNDLGLFDKLGKVWWFVLHERTCGIVDNFAKVQPGDLVERTDVGDDALKMTWACNQGLRIHFLAMELQPFVHPTRVCLPILQRSHLHDPFSVTKN